MTTSADTPMTVRVYAADGVTLLCEFPYFVSLSILDVYNNVGSFTFNWNSNSPNGSKLISDTDLQIAVTMDRRDGNGYQEIWRGFYEQDNYDPSMSESAIVQATGRSIIAILKNGIVYPKGGVGSTTTSWSFSGASPGKIMNDLLVAAQARGCFPLLTWDFTAGQDSSGNAWAHGFTNAYTAGTNLFDLIVALAQGGLCDFSMTGLVLHLYNPKTTLASDNSSTVFIRRGREVINSPQARDRTQIATVMLAQSDNGLNVERTASTYGTLGRKESFLSQAGVTDTGTLNYWADQALGAIDDQLISLTPTYTIDTAKNTPIPWKNYTAGNYVSMDVSGTPVKYQVYQMAVQCGPGGPTFVQPTLNGVFYSREVLVQGALTRMGSGAIISGPGVSANPAPGPNPTVPNAPAFVPANIYTAAYYSPSTGTTVAQIELNWTTPTNTDGTTMIDGFQYVIQYKLATVPIYPVLWSQLQGKPWSSINGNPWTNPLATSRNLQWTTATVGINNNSAIVQGLICGETYNFQIACTDVSGNTSLFSGTSAFVTAADTVAPVQPDAPTVSASMVAVQVMHDLGSETGGSYNLAQDLDHLEVHYSYDPSFTPQPGVGSATYLGKLIANAGMIVAQIAAVGTFQVTNTNGIYIKVIAVDVSGNASPPSPGSGVTAVLIDDSHISSLSVTKLIAGTISATVILGSSISTATSGSRVSMDGGTDALYTYDNNGVLIGAWAGRSGTDPATGKAFPVGWSIFNDYNNDGKGYVQVVSGTPGGAFSHGSPTIVLSSDDSQSTKLAQIYSNAGTGWETLRIDGSISQSSVDPHLSHVWIELNGGFADDYAQGHLVFADTGGSVDRIFWNKDGVLVRDGPLSNLIGGDIVNNCSQNGGLGYRHIFYNVINGTTNAAGQLTFSHQAPFTPAFFFATSTGAAQTYSFQNITSTTAQVTVYSQNGTVINTLGVNFWLACIG